MGEKALHRYLKWQISVFRHTIQVNVEMLLSGSWELLQVESTL